MAKFLPHPESSPPSPAHSVAANQIRLGGEIGDGFGTLLSSFYWKKWCTRTTHTHSVVGQKAVAPGDGGLGERRMLALTPSFWQGEPLSPLQRSERERFTIRGKAFWVIPGPLHVPSWGSGKEKRGELGKKFIIKQYHCDIQLWGSKCLIFCGSLKILLDIKATLSNLTNLV